LRVSEEIYAVGQVQHDRLVYSLWQKIILNLPAESNHLWPIITKSYTKYRKENYKKVQYNKIKIKGHG